MALNMGAQEVLGAAQVLLGLIALFVAPEAISKGWTRIRTKLVAEAQPGPRLFFAGPYLWKINLRNTAGNFRDLELHVYPERQGNKIVFYQMSSESESGLHFQHEIEHGCLIIRFSKFFRRRQVLIGIAFSEPDIPAFDEPKVGVRISLPAREEIMIATGHGTELTQYRIKLTLMVFVIYTSLICISLIAQVF